MNEMISTLDDLPWAAHFHETFGGAHNKFRTLLVLQF